MNTEIKILLMVVFAIGLIACSKDDTLETDFSGTMTHVRSGVEGYPATMGDLMTFDIVVDSTSLDEIEPIITSDEDYIENNTFDKEINIHYDNDTVIITGSTSGVRVNTNGAHVTVVSTTKGVCYTLSGNTNNGSFKLYGDNKYALRLNGVSITNPSGATINSQSKKRGYIILADGTWNTLQDGTSYDTPSDEDMKATLFSEGKLLFSGTGHLKVFAQCKGGITSDDYIVFWPGINIYIKNTVDNGIKAKEAILMHGGVINVECSGYAAKGMKSDGRIQIDGGRFITITTGGGEWDCNNDDVNGCAGIKCDSTLTMNGGTLCVKSTGDGGKGISCNDDMHFNGGNVKVITTGKEYRFGRFSTSPKGIKCDKDIYLSGSMILLRATGGEKSEGIECDGKLSIIDGEVEIYTHDDPINVRLQIDISGGRVFTYSINNDGIDSNGTIEISGGTVITCGTSYPEDGIDCDWNTFSITGGTIFAIGGTSSTPSASTSTQPSAIVGGSDLTVGSSIALAGNDGENIYAFTVPRNYYSYTILVSAPGMVKGGKCTLTTEADFVGENHFNGFVTSANVSEGITLASLSLDDIVTIYNFTNPQPSDRRNNGW